MTREQMIDKVIEKYGFEAEATRNFCELCEWAGNSIEADEAIRTDFEAWMAKSIFLDEE